jgi:hypothetical protein
MKDIELKAWGSAWQADFEALQEHVQSLESEVYTLRAAFGTTGDLLAEANKIRDARVKETDDSQMRLPGL